MAVTHVLIANRGEIACRVIRAARVLGLRSTAVFTDIDAASPHVSQADHAIRIGSGPAASSYLDAEVLIRAAQQAGADAIHPGYGFLSENAAFARAVTDAGLTFVGPDAAAIELMGDKARARAHVADAGVPVVPGFNGEMQTDAAFVAAADAIGFPVMIKASAGGGGRGMRLVQTGDSLADALAAARQESLQAFGSDHLILERAVLDAKHVEVQLLCDAHGTVVSVGERDCSVQRRHQKLIEEAPCITLTSTQRSALLTAARRAAESVSYTGAGTVEFLVDADGAFFFLEMNTRIQVEHPVTEMVAGVDLVAWQLRIAAGDKLTIDAESVAQSHAIEVRICAEQPQNDFLPSGGRLRRWRMPSMPDVRIDSGVVEGNEVSMLYDSMLAKMIVKGPTREHARLQLLQALRDTCVMGVDTNIGFLIDALNDPRFIDASATTTFVDSLPPLVRSNERLLTDVVVAAVLDVVGARMIASSRTHSDVTPLFGWCSADALVSHHRFQIDDLDQDVSVSALSGDHLVVTCDQAVTCDVVLRHLSARRFELLLDDRAIAGEWCRERDGSFWTCREGITLAWRNAFQIQRVAVDLSVDGDVLAPMHGRIVRIEVAVGDTVRSGSVLCVLEAMKMQHSILATTDCQIVSLGVAVDQQVARDDVLLQCEHSETA